MFVDFTQQTVTCMLDNLTPIKKNCSKAEHDLTVLTAFFAEVSKY